MIGKTISHYKIIDKLGAGGMGVVYKAEDTKLKRIVALKFLPPALSMDDEAKTRFINEARVASALDHPNICTIHEIGETEDGQSFITMACYEGESLKDYIVRKRDNFPPRGGIKGSIKDSTKNTPLSPPLPGGKQRGGIPVEKSIAITIQIAKGLARAHEEGIIHRDIKPANIMITNRGEVKILDFGLAKLTGETRLTKTGTTIGTVAYMSPEQARGDSVDQRSDIWSLGVILYEMLSGQLPFRGEFDQAIIYSIMNEDPEPLQNSGNIPSELIEIIDKVLAKDVNDRYQTIEELLTDFEPLSTEAVLVREESFSRFILRTFRKRHVRYFSFSIAAIILSALFLLLLKPLFFRDLLYASPPAIAVINFENQTGDKANDILAKMILTLLITKLEQSGGLRVLSWERLYDLKKQIGQDSVEFIDLDLGIKLCQMDNVDMIVTGTLMKAGELFATDVKILDVNSKNIINSAGAKGEGEESILKSQVDQLGKEICFGMDVPESKIDALQKPVREITTTSTEAYKYYIQGRELHLKWRHSEAKPFYELAIEHDSTFALAFHQLWRIYLVLSLHKQSSEARLKAMEYSENASERESLSIQMQFYQHENPDKADSLNKMYLEKYGTKKQFHNYMAGQYKNIAEYDKAIEEYNEVIKIDPESAGPYCNLGYLYLIQKNYDMALKSFRKYASLAQDNEKANAYDCIADVYMKMGDVDAMIAAFKEVYRIDPNNPWGTERLALSYAWKEQYHEAIKWSLRYKNQYRPDIALYDKGLYNFLLGRRKQALVDLDRAIQIADSIYKAGEEPGTLWNAPYLKAWIYYEMDQFEKSRDEFLNTKNYSGDSAYVWVDKLWSHKFNGMTYIRSGQLDSAKSYQNSIYLMSQDTMYSVGQRYGILYYYDLIKAEILLAEDSAELALDLADQIKFNYFSLFKRERVIVDLFPFQYDLEARAYLKLGKINEAVEEYERLISDDPKIRGWHIIPAIYHYILGQLYEQKGWPGKAIEQYKRFLEVWKDADADITELSEARERLAVLVEGK